MKNQMLSFALVLYFLTACGSENNAEQIADENVDEPTENIIEAKVIFDQPATDHFQSNSIAQWKTDDHTYPYFIKTELDTVYIGPNREITNPFDFFRLNELNNLYVILDSGRYINDSGLWINNDNIIIKGMNGVSLLIDQLHDNVMWISGKNIVVDNLHMMHLMPGESEGQNCSGRVIGFDNADNITILNCDLNGCGLAGLHDNLGNGTVYIEYNYIHNNSLGAYTDIDGNVWLEAIENHTVFQFKNNWITNNGPNRVPED